MELKEKYPERKFYKVDTKAITVLGYAVAKEAIRLYQEGKTAEEMIAHLEDFRDHYTVYFYADDLKFFAKSGRVSNFAAFMGGLIGLHPIIYMGDDGKYSMYIDAVNHKFAKNSTSKERSIIDENNNDILIMFKTINNENTD
jgi:fatty acid-binding protein DegV